MDGSVAGMPAAVFLIEEAVPPARAARDRGRSLAQRTVIQAGKGAGGDHGPSYGVADMAVNPA